jgi:hypothetical protein
MIMQQVKITTASILSRNADKFLASRISNETVMMNMDSGDYIGINQTGSEIWEKLEVPVSVQSLIDQILQHYDVPEEQCKTETILYLQQMLAQEMLTVHTHSL